MENLTASAIVAIKNIGYIGAFAMGAHYLGISNESITILGVVLIIDIFTGILKAGIVVGWRSITSARLAAGVISKLLLLFVPITVALGGKGSGVDMSQIAQGAISVLILAQVYSIIGNIHAVQIHDNKNEFDAVGFLLLQLRNVLEKAFKGNDPTPNDSLPT